MLILRRVISYLKMLLKGRFPLFRKEFPLFRKDWTRRDALRSILSVAGVAAVPAALSGLSGCSYGIESSGSYIHGRIKPKNLSAVSHWTDIMLQAVRNQSVIPPLATRAFAMGHLAGFLAVNGVTPRYRTKFNVGEGPKNATPEVAYAVAFATAIEDAFQALFPLDLSRYLAKFPDGDGKTQAVNWGKKVGSYVVGMRTRDGGEASQANFYHGRYPQRNDALSWSPTGPFYGAEAGPAFGSFGRGAVPGWGAQKPWAMKNAADFLAVDFPEMGSAEFVRQFKKIKTIGGINSSTRTPDETQIAFFWEDGPRGVTPPGHWQIIAMEIIQEMDFDLLEQARLFAMMSMSQADAAITTWHSKYVHEILRPETAIRQRVPAFGNKALAGELDPNWQTLIPTPGFPAYVSGHSAFSAASARMIAKFIGRDAINFASSSPDLVNWPVQLTGVRRSWTSLWQAAQEGGDSREYGGIHWESDNTEGLRIGRDLADFVFKNAFERVG